MGIDESLHMYYTHQIIHLCQCVPKCGIAFCSAYDMHTTCVFHACHVELVANLYHISICGEFIEYWLSFKISLPTYSYMQLDSENHPHSHTVHTYMYIVHYVGLS